ncbi:MAG: peptidoglycan-binding domain-containing protein [Desertimonas sp.]
MRRVLGFVALGVVLAGCAQSENTIDDTLPTIAPVATTTTTTTAPPIPITAGATAVVTPAPITAPPAPAPAPDPAPAAPTTVTPAAPAAATTTTTTATTTAAATTTTSLLAPTLTPLACTAAALDAADPAVAHGAPSCLAGWAVEATADGSALVFAAGTGGWALAGSAELDCPAPLVAMGMPMSVAVQFAAASCDEPAGPSVIRPADEGDAVRGLQVALVALGYQLETDGIFGPRTEAAVRHFQTTAGLEADGLVGPATQAALFAASAAAPAAPEPLACTAAALDAADSTRTHAAPTCRAGWAIESPPCTSSPCGGSAPVFIAGPAGWVMEGSAALDCPHGLVQLGMPVAVAESFTASACDEPAGPSVIRPGDEGGPVRGVQVALVARGYEIDTDGIFGPGTEAAVRDFQAEAGLDVDGLAGPATQAALFAAS